MGKWLSRVIDKDGSEQKNYQNIPKGSTDKTDKIQNQGLLAGLVDCRPDRGKSIQEAAKLFKERDWVQIFSDHLNQSIYLVKNERTQVPDPAFPRYTQKEIEASKGLSWEEVKTLHEAKILFKGAIGYAP